MVGVFVVILVFAASAALPPRVARALLLHRLGGHSIAEIAGELGCAEITVKKYLARALLHCRTSTQGGEL